MNQKKGDETKRKNAVQKNVKGKQTNQQDWRPKSEANAGVGGRNHSNVRTLYRRVTIRWASGKENRKKSGRDNLPRGGAKTRKKVPGSKEKKGVRRKGVKEDVAMLLGKGKSSAKKGGPKHTNTRPFEGRREELTASYWNAAELYPPKNGNCTTASGGG